MTLRLGILGAIGVDDIGDVVMLEANLKELLEESRMIGQDVHFVVFALNAQKASEQLAKIGGFQVTVVPSLSASDLPEDFLNNIGSFSSLMSNSDWEHLIPNWYIKAIAACDCLYYIGGGYFNKYWGDRLWPTFVIPLALGYRFNKPVFISGVTIGPFNDGEIKRLYGLFRECCILILRDHDSSVKTLNILGGCSGSVILGADDLLPNWAYKENISGINDCIPIAQSYGVIHLHFWVEKFADDPSAFYRSLAGFIDQLIEQEKVRKIVFLPFDYHRKVDYDYGNKLAGYVHHSDDYILMTPTEDHVLMRHIIKHASFVIASRYHPVVFSLGEGTPVLGVYVNDLYKQKIQGAFEVVGVQPDEHSLYINEVDPNKLWNWYSYNQRGDSNMKLINKYREQKRELIARFLQSR